MASNSASAASTAEQRANSQPKWVNPCGFNPAILGVVVGSSGNDGGDGPHNDSPNGGNGLDTNVTPTKELLDRIVYQTGITFRKAQDFKEDFAQKTFNQNADQVSFNNNVFEWLPSKDEIPKELGNFVSMDHLSSLALDETLLNTYEYLQKIAVGLEQILWDQQDYHGDFVQQFKDSENHLRLLLCEIQTAMIERGIQMRPDVTRDLMPEEHRITDKTFRKLRDWIIYREYMNALEYVKQVFEYLKQMQQ